ncbi:MAG: two-component regulator propeller domain-containing protein [Verrucomicrobiota bacterium]
MASAVALILNSSVRASDEFLISQWQVQDGLPQSSGLAFEQTAEGYLWISTFNGLARFDGTRFVTYDQENTPAMMNSHVSSLIVDERGIRIMTGKDDWLRYEEGRFVANTALKGHVLFRTPDGRIWSRKDEAIFQVVNHVPEPVIGQQKIAFETWIEQGGKRARQSFWPGSGGAIAGFEGTNVFQMEYAELRNNAVIVGMDQGELWLLYETGYRRVLENGRTGEFKPFPWGAFRPAAACVDQSGNLWAGFYGRGLYRISRDESFVDVSKQPGFPQITIRAIFQDRERNIWVGTDGAGILRLRPRPFHVFDRARGLESEVVYSVSPAGGGGVWIACNSGGVWRLHENQIQALPAPNVRSASVWSVLEDSQGRIWSGTLGAGLFHFHAAREEAVPALAGNTVTALLEARNGTVWFGGDHGLARLTENSAFEMVSRTSGWTGGHVRSLMEDNSGAIWIGTQTGLWRWNQEGFQRLGEREGLDDAFVQALHFDDAGALWIGTKNRGLFRLKNGRVAHIGAAQGLQHRSICSLLDDGLGNLWCSTARGILRARRRILEDCADGKISRIEYTAYDIGDGLPTLECTGQSSPKACRTPDGRLWFPTVKGLVAVDPNKVTVNTNLPPVVIEEVLVDDKPLPFSAPGKLTAAPGARRLEIRYTGLSLATPEKVRFRYRLAGLEEEWTEAHTRRAAHYNRVPPGHYEFQVLACNGDGFWNETGATAAITFRPYLWETRAFQICVMALLVAGVAGMVRSATRRKYQRQMAELERRHALERERARIAQDMHDDLGASLVQLSLLGEVAEGQLANPGKARQTVQRISQTARQTVRSLDEIVWAVNPKNDSLDHFANYICHFALEHFANSGTQCELDVPPDLPAEELTADVRHNLLLTTKEILTNVLKHAKAKRVQVRIRALRNQLNVIIQDDGIGFVREASSSRGDGLENMRRRLAEIGGTMELSSCPGHGTRVELVLPLKHH